MLLYYGDALFFMGLGCILCFTLHTSLAVCDVERMIQFININGNHIYNLKGGLFVLG